MAEVNTGIEVIGEEPAHKFGKMIVKPLYDQSSESKILLEEDGWWISMEFQQVMGRVAINFIKIEAADLYCQDDFTEDTMRAISQGLVELFALGEDYIEKQFSADIVYLNCEESPKFNKRYFSAGYYLEGGTKILSLAESEKKDHPELDDLYNENDSRVLEREEYGILKKALISAGIIDKERFANFEESLDTK